MLELNFNITLWCRPGKSGKTLGSILWRRREALCVLLRPGMLPSQARPRCCPLLFRRDPFEKCDLPHTPCHLIPATCQLLSNLSSLFPPLSNILKFWFNESWKWCRRSWMQINGLIKKLLWEHWEFQSESYFKIKHYLFNKIQKNVVCLNLIYIF